MNEFFTWAFLGTFVGAVAATGILTQFFKSIFIKVPTRVVSYLIALVILVVARSATGDAAVWSDWVLAAFNAALVSLSSNGVYDSVRRIGRNPLE